ncbi:MAG: alcohol dehydrogenase catalytic domain-containing protein [Dehalococcoidia bacterium]
MKAVVKTREALGAELVELDIPQPAADEVLVKLMAGSICGTDVHIYAWDPGARVYVKNLPQILGHEFAGTIVEVGNEVKDFKAGDYVSAETHIYCGRCIQCLNDQRHICETGRVFGLTCNGCFAEYFTIPARVLWKNNPQLPPEVASIQEPLGNAVYCALGDYDKDLQGRSVLIVGDGPIALMAIGVARAEGARLVVILCRHDRRMDIATTMGADKVLKDGPGTEEALSQITDGRGFDVVLEMAGSPEAVDLALKWVRIGGRMSAFGIHGGPFTIENYGQYVRSGKKIVPISGRLIWQTWEEVTRLLESGKLDVSPVITHKLPLEEFEKGFSLMMQRPKVSGKVILLP